MLTRLILTVALCACSAKTGDRSPDPNPPAPTSNNDAKPRGSSMQPPAPAGGAECKTAGDCMVSCFSAPDDCCGDACGCEHPYTKTAGEALEQTRQASCPSRPQSCREARCVIKHLKPDCVNGHCTAVP